MRIYRSQLRQELTVMIRNGEQLLLLVVIPVMLLVFFSQTDFLSASDENKIDFLLPGILSLAVISTAMVSLGDHRSTSRRSNYEDWRRSFLVVDSCVLIFQAL